MAIEEVSEAAGQLRVFTFVCDGESACGDCPLAGIPHRRLTVFAGQRFHRRPLGKGLLQVQVGRIRNDSHFAGGNLSADAGRIDGVEVLGDVPLVIVVFHQPQILSVDFFVPIGDDHLAIPKSRR